MTPEDLAEIRATHGDTQRCTCSRCQDVYALADALELAWAEVKVSQLGVIRERQRAQKAEAERERLYAEWVRSEERDGAHISQERERAERAEGEKFVAIAYAAELQDALDRVETLADRWDGHASGIAHHIRAAIDGGDR